MNRRFFAIFFLLITKTALSQKPAVEAVYFDSNQIPYKIERKYLDSNCETYVVHNNETSFCVKRWTYKSGDTTIRKEASYSMVVPKLKGECFLHCEMLMVTKNMQADTIWLKGCNRDSTGNLVYVCDTVLTGDAAKNGGGDFPDRVKQSRVPSILAGDLVVQPDSLVLEETMIAYFVNRIPVRVEFFYDGKLHSNTESIFYQNKIVYRKYFSENEVNPYEADTVTWNADTTDVNLVSDRFEWKKSFVSKFQICGKEMAVEYDEGQKQKITFLDDKDIFRNILISELLYDDVLYTVELRLFDRQKLLSMTSGEETTNNVYKFDLQKRIVEQFTYTNNELQKRITYAY